MPLFHPTDSATKASGALRLAQRLQILFLVFSLVAVARANERWVTLKDCRYLPNPANDGDSFHVRTAGKEYIFRLYFVDTPETDMSLPERVVEQAKYFGLTIVQNLQLSEEARRFTRQKLSQPFVVRTCLEDARGRSLLPRYFAFVETEGGDLAEELVANGLARLHGAASTPAGMNSAAAEWEKLRHIESKASEQKLGGWGASRGSWSMRAQTRASADSFEDFFHQKTAKPTPASPSSAVARALPGSAAKLDINRASAEELQSLPGIGAVLAARIIALRPFKSADELQNVRGIGSKRYEKLRRYFN